MADERLDKTFEGTMRLTERRLVSLERRQVPPHPATVNGKHVTDDAATGRAYFGTGSEATNENGTYLGLSPATPDTAQVAALWLRYDGQTIFQINKDGTVHAPGNDTGWTNLSSHLLSTVSAGELWGRAIGDSVWLRVAGLTVTAPSSVTTTELFSGLPTQFRPGYSHIGNAWYAGYSGGLVVRANGTGGVTQRTGASWAAVSLGNASYPQGGATLFDGGDDPIA